MIIFFKKESLHRRGPSSDPQHGAPKNTAHLVGTDFHIHWALVLLGTAVRGNCTDL